MKLLRALPLASAFLPAQAQVPMPAPPMPGPPEPTLMHVPTAPPVPAPEPGPADQASTMVKGSLEAINYRLLTSATRIAFQGTDVAPEANGMAKVKTRDGISTIKAKFANLPAASTFGEACLTYVLWAVSPEGETANLGELQVKKGKSKLTVTEQLPSFGLMVTAEPYFAVARPSDLFKTGKASLVPEAREKLAKVAGILAIHKGLKIEADGFTDSTGPAPLNERLSQSRAQAARDFLVSQGVAPDAIVSRGFGADHPIADNSTTNGRQENRRVELVVSGEGITSPTEPPGQAPAADQP
jgi:outer membrane protein OmpA-like peptidoglycan-associated protein